MRYLFTLLLGLGLALAALPDAQAQGPRNPKQGQRERMMEVRRNILAEELGLNTQDSARFFPLYDQYTMELVKLHKQRRQLEKGLLVMSDAQLKDAIQQALQLEQQEADIKKNYYNKFMSVLSTRQVAALMQAEGRMKARIIDAMRQSRN